MKLPDGIKFNKKCDKRITDEIMGMFMVSETRFFGEFCLYMNFHEVSESQKDKLTTMGVYVNSNGMHCFYNKKFLDELNNAELRFVIIHEVLHLLCNHIQRTLKLSADRKLSNIAQDMIINNEIVNTIKNKNMISLPKEALLIPKEYKDKHIYEILYYWLVQKQDDLGITNMSLKELIKTIQDEFGISGDGGSGNSPDGKEGKEGKEGKGSNSDGGDSNGGGSKDGSGNSPDGKKEKEGKGGSSNGGNNEIPDKNISLKGLLAHAKLHDYKFDCHLESDIDGELQKQIVDNVIDGLKARGTVPGNIEEMIKRLRESKVNYLKEIEESVNHLSKIDKYHTYRRPNRRLLPIKGRMKESKIINCIWDTSGSMNGYHEKVLSYIFRNNICINLIQCDTQVNDIKLIKRKKELEKINIKGHGGTTLQPAFDMIKSNKELRQYNTLVLTDGFTDEVDASGLRKILVLTVESNMPIHGNNRVKQIVIKE